MNCFIAIIMFLFSLFSGWLMYVKDFFFLKKSFLTVCMYYKLIVCVFLASWVLLYKLRFNLTMWTSCLVNLLSSLTPTMTACWSVVYFSCPLVILFDLVSFSLSLSFSSFLTCPVPSSSGCGIWLGRMNFSAGELWKGWIARSMDWFCPLKPRL